MKRTNKKSLTVSNHITQPVKKVYDLSFINQVTQSGWTMDFYLDNQDGKKLGLDVPVVYEYEPLHDALTALVETWQRTEFEDGGVITYTRIQEE